MNNNKKIIFIAAAILLLFLLIRLPGISLPYHQDEWKNVAASATVESAGAFFDHPPLLQMLFVVGHNIFGTDYFRIFPLIFSLASAILLFAIARRRLGESSALWATFFLAIVFYNIFASVQPDVDGAIIPFFFLLSIFAYDNFLSGSVQKWKWFALLVTALFLGLLVKLSFVLVIGVLLLDYFWENRREIFTKKTAFISLGSALFAALYIAILFIIEAIYPAFSIESMSRHAGQFSEDLGRNWTQILVQALKAIYFLSPLLLAPVLFLSKEIFARTRIFFIYLFSAFVFYFIIFDFSRGALDKYLMFAIAPLAIIVGAIFARIFSGEVKRGPIVAGVLACAFLVALNFLPQNVVALYPKTEWFSRVLSGQWNILTPFTGGSGPSGFYVSFLFIASAFIISILMGVLGFFKKEWRAAAAAVLLVVGVSYNAVFAQELFFGKINGSVKKVLAETTQFLSEHDEIEQVLTYNDTGAGAFTGIGKYGGRFYATPDFEEGHKKRFAEFPGDFVVINVPLLYQDGFYGKFFSNCRVLFETRSGEISGRVYNCDTAKKLINRL